jgi:hypothetical protein
VLTLHQSTVNDNTADYGGGLYGLGEVTLRQSTVSGNTARLSGGGLYNGGVLTLRQSTVSNNTARFGGGLANYGVVTLSTTLILGNRATRLDADCYQYASFGTLQNHGYNLTGAGTGCPSDPTRGDLTVDPAVVFLQVLKPLRNNGGRTQTHALRPGSPALDASDPATCSGTDQRGVARPQGTGCDIGAFELEVP